MKFIQYAGLMFATLVFGSNCDAAIVTTTSQNRIANRAANRQDAAAVRDGSSTLSDATLLAAPASQIQAAPISAVSAVAPTTPTPEQTWISDVLNSLFAEYSRRGQLSGDDVKKYLNDAYGNAITDPLYAGLLAKTPHLFTRARGLMGTGKTQQEAINFVVNMVVGH